MADAQEIPDQVLSTLSDQDLAHIAGSKSVDEAMGKMSDDALSKIASYKPPESKGMGQYAADAFDIFGRKAASALTLGASEPMFSGLNAMVGQGMKAAGGAGMSALSPSEIGKAYDADVAYHKQAYAEQPLAAITGEGAGMFIPVGLSAKLAGTLGTGVRAGTEAIGIGRAAPAGAGVLSRGLSELGQIGQAGAEGAAIAGAQTGIQNQVLERTGFQKPGESPSALEAMKFGGLAGASIRTLPTVIEGIANTGKSVGKGAMTVFLGPRKEIQNAYLKDAEAIKGAGSREEVKNLIDNTVGGYLNAVEQSKMSHADAKEGLKAIEQKIRDVSTDASHEFGLTKYDVNSTLKDARAQLDNAFRAETEKLSAIKSPIHLADETQAALQDGKKQLKQLSSEGYDILGKSNHPVSLQEPFQELANVRETLMVAGQSPITEEAQQALSKIDGLIERTGKLPPEIPASEAKKLVQQLDSAIDYGVRNGAFTSETQQALTGLRRGVDRQLKKVPGYADKMQEASELAKVLEQASEHFGTPQKAVSTLNQIAGRTSGLKRGVLGALGSATGRDLLTPIDQFVAAQGTLKDPRALEQIRSQLPEFSNARKAELASEALAHPDAKGAFVESQIGRAGLREQHLAAEKGLAERMTELQSRQADADRFSRLGPGSSQNAIASVMKAPGKENIETRKALEDLSKASGKDFLAKIENIRVKEAFDAQNTNGSRNAKMFGAIGGGIGSFFGEGLGGTAVGYSIGSTLGGVVDKFGPKMAQKILDGVLKTESTTAGIVSALDRAAAGNLSKIAVEPDLSMFSRPQNASTYTEIAKEAKSAMPANAMNRRMIRLRGDGSAPGVNVNKK